MMRRHVAVLMLLVFPSSVLAEELKYIPKWKMCGDKACYEFAEAKKLFELDAELDRLLKGEALHQGIELEFKRTVKLLNEGLEAEKSANNTLKESNEKLNALLVKETTRANKAEAKPGPFPAWAIGAGVGLAVGVVAGIILGVYVAK
jgi:hypothetical protein